MTSEPGRITDAVTLLEQAIATAEFLVVDTETNGLGGDAFIDAAEAKQQGLVNRVVPADALDAELAQLAASICAKPVDAVSAGKGLFYRQLKMGIEAAYQLAGQTMACNMMDDSALEGVQAFIDKRAPNWKR